MIKKPHYQGLEDLEIKYVQDFAKDEYEAIDVMMESLFDNNDIYFCDTLKGVNPDCEHIIQGLLEKLLDFSSDITIVDVKGSYYGDWRTVTIIGSDWKSNKSVSLEFDILHEI